MIFAVDERYSTLIYISGKDRKTETIHTQRQTDTHTHTHTHTHTQDVTASDSSGALQDQLCCWCRCGGLFCLGVSLHHNQNQWVATARAPAAGGGGVGGGNSTLRDYQGRRAR